MRIVRFIDFYSIDNDNLKKVYESLKLKSSSEFRKRIKTQPKQNFIKENSSQTKSTKDGRNSEKYKQHQTLLTQSQVTPFKASPAFKLRPDSSMTESETRSSYVKSKLNNAHNIHSTKSKKKISTTSKFMHEPENQDLFKTQVISTVKPSKVASQQKYKKSAVKGNYKVSIRDGVKNKLLSSTSIQNNQFSTLAEDNTKMKTKRSRNQDIYIGGTQNLSQNKSQKSLGFGNTTSSASMALMIDEIMKQEQSSMKVVKKKLNPDHREYQ